MPLDLATAQAHLETWLAAETAVAKGQSYAIGNRQMRRADLAEIRASIEFWDAKVQQLTANNGQRGIRIRGATPIG